MSAVPALPMLSVVVSSYGRFKQIQELVESVRIACKLASPYKIFAVCSDPPDSPKIQWLRQQDDVHLIHPDVRTGSRVKSLYYYENLGIKLAPPGWIFVTNDDTTLDPGFYENLLKYDHSYDILSVKAGISRWFPIIGTLCRVGETCQSPLYLYDFTVIRRWVYDAINYLDENLDWFGKGWDLSLKCEFLARPKGARICYDTDLYVHHSFCHENRSPPECHNDFRYIEKKWDDWCASNPGYHYTCPW